MLPSFCRDEVEVMRAPMRDERGTPCADWGAATVRRVGGCAVQPSTTSSGRGEAREAVSCDAVLYAPPGSDIAAHDRVRWHGITYEVEGAPMERESPTGAVSHVEARLKRWEG